jgi:large subunit ribosomal protein L13
MVDTMAHVIDATNTILGRMAALAAKAALNGEEVVVINAEKAVISGNPDEVKARYLNLRENVGNYVKGPFLSRMPDRLVRRTIRGMLPRKTTRGREAFRRIQVYIGTPADVTNAKVQEKNQATKLKDQRYITVGELCKHLGAKW